MSKGASNAGTGSANTKAKDQARAAYMMKHGPRAPSCWNKGEVKRINMLGAGGSCYTSKRAFAELFAHSLNEDVYTAPGGKVDSLPIERHEPKPRMNHNHGSPYSRFRIRTDRQSNTGLIDMFGASFERLKGSNSFARPEVM